MNKHIELVKKWLADKDSVSQEELNVNAKAAAELASEADEVAAEAAVRAAYAAARAAYPDASSARADWDAAYWVNSYEELTNE